MSTNTMKNLKITPEEIEIIKRAQAGDESAFTKLFNKYKVFVVNILFSYIKDIDEANDICNIVFIKVHNKLNQFSNYESFGGWLRILTNRTAIDYIRSMKSKEMTFDADDYYLSPNTSIGDNENDLVNRMTFERISACFASLPVMHKQVNLLYYNENMTVSQISKTMNIPKGTVKSVLSRTRKIIKKKFN